MKCPDCKGSGKYIGARVVEDCQRCEGVGVIGEGAAKAKALKSVAKANLPEWMKDYAEKIDFDGAHHYRGPAHAILNPDPDDPNIKRIKELIANPPQGWSASLMPELKVGDIIHIYDAGWHEAEVTNRWLQHGKEMVRADAPCDSFRIPYYEMSYNVTQGRWEYIRAGTPVWP